MSTWRSVPRDWLRARTERHDGRFGALLEVTQIAIAGELTARPSARPRGDALLVER